MCRVLGRMRVTQLPARYRTRFGIWGVLPFAVITALFAASATRITFSSSLHVEMPPDAARVLYGKTLLERFRPGDLVLVSYHAGDPFTLESLATIDRLHRAVAAVDGVLDVTSVASVQDIIALEHELAFVPVLGRPISRNSATRTRETVLGTRVFRETLLSGDGTSWSIWVVPDRVVVAEEFVAELYHAVEPYPEVTVYGDVVIDARLDREIRRESILMLVAGMVIAYLVFLRICRGVWADAAYLWTGACMPTIWVLGVFPVIGAELSVYTLPVPLVVLALGTSYGIHIYRHFRTLEAPAMGRTITKVTPIVAMAAATTGVGLATLFLSRIVMLRSMALLLVLGVFFAMFTALFALPCVFRSRGGEHADPGDGVVVRSSPRFYLVGVLLIGFLVPIGIIGSTRVYTSTSVQQLLWPGDQILRSREYLAERYGGIETIEIVLDTRSEYGVVDPDTYAAIHRFSEALRQMSGIYHVISVTDFANFVHTRLSGNSDTALPVSDAEIGEALELMSSAGHRFSVRSLIDASYALTRITIRIATDGLAPREAALQLERLIAGIYAVADRYIPGIDAYATGYRLERELTAELLVRDQAQSIAVFFPLLFVLLGVAFRSARWAVACLIPPAIGVLVFLGGAGMAGVALNTATPVMLAVVMGVGVDDAIYFSELYRRERRIGDACRSLALTWRRAGLAAYQTTAIICLSMTPLFFSQFRTIFAHAVLAVLSFSAATFCALTVVPWLIRRYIDTIPDAPIKEDSP